MSIFFVNFRFMFLDNQVFRMENQYKIGNKKGVMRVNKEGFEGEKM